MGINQSLSLPISILPLKFLLLEGTVQPISLGKFQSGGVTQVDT